MKEFIRGIIPEDAPSRRDTLSFIGLTALAAVLVPDELIGLAKGGEATLKARDLQAKLGKADTAEEATRITQEFNEANRMAEKQHKRVARDTMTLMGATAVWIGGNLICDIAKGD